MILGITGNYASGKDSVAEILEKMNFRHVSFSNLLRAELIRTKTKITRKNLIDLGNQLRQERGADILARIALKKIEDGENYVFTSIRNPQEVKLLQEREDFLLINVIAPDNLRLKRILKRNREEDPKTLKQLKEKESLENTPKPTSQQLNQVAKLAKIVLNNDSTLEKLQQKTEKLVDDWMFKLQPSRPNWDHYFMGIAEAVKQRCNCMSAKKGAIIVKDKQILSTGYNGTPRKIRHCTQGHCPRCILRHQGKVKSADYAPAVCICAHAEENAIVQAAHNGTSTKDAALYTTFTPCNTCARMIINAGIKEVIAKKEYPDDVGTKLLKEANVKLRVLK